MNLLSISILILFALSIIGFIPLGFSETVHVSIPKGSSVEGCETNNECYIPFGVKIDVDDTVIWTNEDLAFHTVTSGNPRDGSNGVFDSGMFKIDEQFSHKFENSGNFDYFCTLHPWMEGIVEVQAALPMDEPENGGGCLIATATYGSELAPQVQQLRELRDNKLLQTKLGMAFVDSFNGFYYSFSPTISDYEREYPFFKEGVKTTITPMIWSLSILNQVEMDSEAQVLGYGLGVIVLNIGFYFGVPVAIVFGLRKQNRKKLVLQTNNFHS